MTTTLDFLRRLVAVSFVLMVPAAVQAQNAYTFQMLDVSSNPVPSTLTINLGDFTAAQVAALPATTIGINGRVANSPDSFDNLLLIGFTPGYSGSAPNNLGDYFTVSNGGTGPVGDCLAPGDTNTEPLGTFNESAFLIALVANGDHSTHTLSASFTLSGNAADLGCNDTGIGFAPDVTPGPPSLMIAARIISASVPEPGVVALLLGTALTGALLLKRARKFV
jgi:hypothetical protein